VGSYLRLIDFCMTGRSTDGARRKEWFGEQEEQRVRERESFIDNLLVRIHFIVVMIRWTGHAPWEFEFPFPLHRQVDGRGAAERVVQGSGGAARPQGPERPLVAHPGRDGGDGRVDSRADTGGEGVCGDGEAHLKL